MKPKIAFWIALGGTVLATVLRCVQMLFFFDYETGFVTDSGIFTALYCTVILLCALACGILCRLERTLCGTMQRERSWGCGISASMAALFLGYGAFVLLKDAYNYKMFGVSYSVEPVHILSHVPFAVLSGLFCVAALVVTFAWLRDGKLPGNIGALWAVGVLWALYYMVLTFMTYSASATMQENLFTMGGGALMLFFLLAEGKLISGVGGRKASRSVFIFGIPAVIFWLTYVLSNTVLIIFGRGYVTEMPYVIQLMMFALSVHAVMLMAALRNRELFVPSMQGIERSERKKAQ